MKRLIVNADDFGLSEGINKGIIECHKSGFLTSTTLMVNTPAFESAVKYLKDNPSIGVGIHLNIVRGGPVQPMERVRSLVNKDGEFLTFSELLRNLVLRRVSLKEVELEFKGQIQNALNKGLLITHIDSHRHIHIYPSIARIVKNLCVEFNIKRMRCPVGLRYPLKRWFDLREGAISSFALLCKKKVLHDGVIKTADFYCDLFKRMENGDYYKIFETFCKDLPEGVTEISCHPGYRFNHIGGSEAVFHNREKHVRFLLDHTLKGLLVKHNIRLTDYSRI